MGEMVIATTRNNTIRLLAIDSRNIVDEAQRRHDSWPVATAALGRTLTMAALMSASLNDEQRLTLRLLGDGPLGAIVADVDHCGHVRGYVEKPDLFLPVNKLGKLDVASAVGKGMLYVSKDLGLGEPFIGQAPLLSGEIAEDFCLYFQESEQIPTAVSLGVLVNTDYTVAAAGGYLIQMMPGSDEESIPYLEHRLQNLPGVTELLMKPYNPAEILQILVGEWDVTVLERREAHFTCRCSRERTIWTLGSLGSSELNSLLAEQEGAEVTCNFCREQYRFSATELRELIRKIDCISYIENQT